MNNYQNTEVIQRGGKKTVRTVSIKKGRGYKRVSKYYRGKRVATGKAPIQPAHIMDILSKKFVPGLFSDCKTRRCKTRRCKTRRG